MNDLLQQFNTNNVRYLLVGGQAMRLFGMPRSTLDWDFLIPPRDQANISRLNTILEHELDLPLVCLGPAGQNFVQTYQTSFGVLQFHLVLPGISSFEEAETAAVVRKNEKGMAIKCLSGKHLLAAKQAAGRAQDKEDIEFLLELQRAGKLK